MTRLTVSMREQITRAVLKHRFSAEITAVIKERAAFAEVVYNDIFKKSDRDAMQALPEGWLHNDNYISVKFSEGNFNYTNLNFNGSFSSHINSIAGIAPETNYKRVPNKHSRGCAAVYAETSKIGTQYRDISNKIEALEQTIKEAESQLAAALSKATTIANLLKTWPEIEPFTKTFATVKANLPAIPTAKLNCILDLPVAA